MEYEKQTATTAPSAESGPPAYGHTAPASQGQPQQMVVVVPQTVVVVQPTSVSMSGAIALSCFAFWFCGFLGGFIGFILAMFGQGEASEGKVQSAIQLRNASYVVSIVGIVVGIIVIIIVLSLNRTLNLFPDAIL